MGNDKIWLDKKVFIKLKSFKNRSYSGLVIDESSVSITIRDIFGHLVRISFDDISLLQEEVRR